MNTFLQNLAWERSDDTDGVFVATARYYSSMDYLLYLAEDLSYRADRVDEFLTVLWHPYEDRLIGLKLKGFHVLFQRVKSALDLDEPEYLSLVTLVTEAALTQQGYAQKLMGQQEEARLKVLRRKYHLAMEFARKAPGVPPQELQKAA